MEVKAIDTELRRVTALASTGSIDRDEEIILPDAWELDAFRRSPIFLWAHAHRSQDPQNVLGRVVNVEKVPAGLLATFEYDTDINPKAAMVFAQVQKGTIRGYSVGFIPRSWVTSNSPEDHRKALPEMARKALEEGRAFVVYTSAELIEISQVPIPSNPDALVGASAKSARLQELKQLEEATMSKPEEKAVTPEITPEPGPDIEAIVKAAVAEAIAPLQEAIAKMAAPAVAESTEDPAAEEARSVLRAMSDEQLKAFFAAASDQERADAMALFAE